MAERDLTDELTSVIEGLGFSLVECKVQGVRGTLHVNVVAHRRGGMSIDDCAEIHRTLVPRIQVITGNRDISVEVSSPGIDRKFKSRREYQVFVGMPVRILDLESEWISGILQDADDHGITLARDGATEQYAYSEIRAARLNDV
ncbi:MAG: ribosome assembly cofactor RimP [Spirochaetales bacterium]